jgi:hypothetical protein
MRRWSSVGICVLLVAGCGGDPSGPSTSSYAGTYDLLETRELSQSVPTDYQVYCCQNGETSVMRLLGDGTYLETTNDGFGGVSSYAGQFTATKDSLYLTSDAQPGVRYAFGVKLSGGVLTLRRASTLDLNGDGVDEPTFVQWRYGRR